MGEMTPVECWVKESNHGEPKKAGLNHGLKTLRRWWPTGSMYLLVALNLTQSKMGLYNRFTADILNKMALYINRYKCLVSLGKLKAFWRTWSEYPHGNIQLEVNNKCLLYMRNFGISLVFSTEGTWFQNHEAPSTWIISVDMSSIYGILSLPNLHKRIIKYS